MDAKSIYNISNRTLKASTKEAVLMIDRQILFQMANRLHYQAQLSRPTALTVAWNLNRTQIPEYTKARGVSFDGRQQILQQLARRGLRGISARLEREPMNPSDASAIRVELVHVTSGRICHIGYLSRERADRVAPLMDAGIQVEILNLEITGGPGGQHYRNYGLNFAYQVVGVA